MAKTESTAVNQLINLVATATPLPPDPSEDLMFSAPKRKHARMSATVPGVVDVAPLPRSRAPHGTDLGVLASPQGAAVRVTSAPASRGATIPPIPAHRPSAPSIPPPLPAEARATRPSAPSVPQPMPMLPPMMRPSSQRTATNMSPAPATAPAPTPATTPATAMAPTATARASAPSIAALAAAAAAPYMHAAHDMTSNQAWFDHSEIVGPELDVEVEQDIGTDQLGKSTSWTALTGKLVVPMIALVILGVFIGGFIAFDGDGGKGLPTASATPSLPVEAAAVAPVKSEVGAPAAAAITPPNLAAATVPAVVQPETEPSTRASRPAQHGHEIPAGDATQWVARAQPANLVDVRIDSQPSGATVTLVDGGKHSFLGTTPVSASVDPSRQYELVFTHGRKPAHREHLDASTTKRIAVVLGRSTSQALNSPVTKLAQSKPATAPAIKVAPTPDPPNAVKVTKAVKSAPAVVDPFETTPVGEGVLMISSKPPCEISIDGSPTGLMTPQRAIKLPAGKHKITLINTAEKIKKTVTVQINADQPTKVIQDLMSQ